MHGHCETRGDHHGKWGAGRHRHRRFGGFGFGGRHGGRGGFDGMGGEETMRARRMLAQIYLRSGRTAQAIETIYMDYRDTPGLRRDTEDARRDGFTGRMAIHPDQVATINRCYAPSDAEIEHARKIVAAFDANPAAGTLGVDGKMVDIPHLKAARKTLASI